MCSKLYADGELAATPYETDKVLRHRELCMGLNVLYAKKNHDYGDSLSSMIEKTSWSWMPSFFGNCTRSSALVQSV